MFQVSIEVLCIVHISNADKVLNFVKGLHVVFVFKFFKISKYF